MSRPSTGAIAGQRPSRGQLQDFLNLPGERPSMRPGGGIGDRPTTRPGGGIGDRPSTRPPTQPGGGIGDRPGMPRGDPAEDPATARDARRRHR